MKLRKLLALVLAAVAVVGCMSIVAFAGGGATYLYPEYNKTDGTFYENCSSGIKEWKEGTCESFTEVKATDTTWGTSGQTTWYVAMGEISINNTVTIAGDVRLILCDGATLTITGSTGAGIDNYGEGNSFTVYAQSTDEDMGILTVTGGVESQYRFFAGIRSAGGATVTINGGVVTAHKGAAAEYAGACIGGNDGEDGTNITFNGGKVTAADQSNAAGIGGGTNGNGEYVTINGGTVVAGNTNSAGAGIGGGIVHGSLIDAGEAQKGGGSFITINGGDVTATSNGGSGIGSGLGGYTSSYIIITGGTVTAEGVVGIGGNSTNEYGDNFVSAHDIAITGGTVFATSLNGAAIGGFGTSDQISGITYHAIADNITISGSDTVVRATSKSWYHAAIGGGVDCSAQNITIKDGATVIATGGSQAAAIGGGNPGLYNNEIEVGTIGNADSITISGEGTTVIATAGSYGAAIGAGSYGNASNINITDGAKVYATATSGSAIGAGLYGSADGITISDGAEVVAVSSARTAAIGACNNNASNITIDNATVTAKSGDYGTAIGSANGTATNIIIKGEDTVVTAVTGDAEDNSAKGCGSAIGAGKNGSATGIYVDASLLMVQNNDETLTDDMEICKNRTLTEDVSTTVCNKDKCVIVIKPRDAYVAQVGTGDNATKYYFVQTAIDKINKSVKELPYIIDEEYSYYYINENASANFKLNQRVDLDNVTITMIADSSEEIDIPLIWAGLYLEEYYCYSSDLGMGGVHFCQNITLDLNGHVLSSFFDSGESIIKNNGALTLIDSNPTAEHKFTVDDNGLYLWDEAFTSQIFSRLKTDEDGNSFWDDEATTVTVKGGCITGARISLTGGSVETIAGVYNGCAVKPFAGIFNMYAGTITGNGGYSGGVYSKGTMTVGGTAVIEGNTVYGTDTAQNVYLTSGTKITISTDIPFVEGANIGVTTETKPTAGNPVEFTTNGTKNDTKNDEDYFFSDSLAYADKYYNEGTCLDLILGYRVTPREAEGGTISVGNQKSAYDGETVKVKVTPDEGYALDTLAFSGEGIIATNITDKKSFTMPAKEVVITGTFNEADYALSGSVSITDGAVTFKKGDDTVTTAKFGEEITVTAKEVTDYTVTLSSDDVTITDGKFTMPAKAVTITATYTENQAPGQGDDGTYLDLIEGGTYSDSKVLEQKYTFTQLGNVMYVDETKVRIEWEVSDIDATFKSHKTWNPDTLTWDEVKEDASASDQSATFKVTNYSSVAVKANVAFAVNDTVKDTYDASNSTFTNNDCAVETPVTKDTTTTYQDSDFTEKAQTIKVTLKFNTTKFAELAAQDAAAKYGAYTITISDPSAA